MRTGAGSAAPGSGDSRRDRGRAALARVVLYVQAAGARPTRVPATWLHYGGTEATSEKPTTIVPFFVPPW